ncbi:MAG TPA: TerC family protein [Xanthobacteraceae bacterium]|nr:TerC family protein [Xanthobacteraceae bacterium]
MSLDWLTSPEAWIALASLTAIEIVLGIDNVVFISVLVSKLPKEEADRARKIGLALALIFRIILLFFLSWLIGLTQPVIEFAGLSLSWRDIVLVAGGLFLLVKATREVHAEVEGGHQSAATAAEGAFTWVVLQVIIIDLVFSVDSIITAIGMAQQIEVMIIAVIIAVGVMYLSSGPVSAFIAKHPTTKMLALSFLMLIGVALIADGMGFHIPRAYIYFSMAFAAGVEIFNVIASRNRNQKKHAPAKAPAKKSNRKRAVGN